MHEVWMRMKEQDNARWRMGPDESQEQRKKLNTGYGTVDIFEEQRMYGGVGGGRIKLAVLVTAIYGYEASQSAS